MHEYSSMALNSVDKACLYTLTGGACAWCVELPAHDVRAHRPRAAEEVEREDC